MEKHAQLRNPKSAKRQSCKEYLHFVLLCLCALLGSLVVFSAAPGTARAQDQISAKKRSLEEIKQQLDEKKKELEKFVNDFRSYH